MTVQENDTKPPTQCSISSPFYSHQVNTKGDLVERECAKDGFLSINSPKSSTEVPEVDPNLNNSNNNNGNNVQCLSMSPALINPLYEKKANKKTKNPSVSAIRSSERTNTFGKIIQENSNQHGFLKTTSSLSKSIKAGPLSLARVLPPKLNKLYPITTTTTTPAATTRQLTTSSPTSKSSGTLQLTSTTTEALTKHNLA
ncbi:unnamed protein product [Trichobilharzia szidati]|nr:unnamed protein product [Trichobilharzia szidati]